jgi:hypothetical protein
VAYEPITLVSLNEPPYAAESVTSLQPAEYTKAESWSLKITVVGVAVLVSVLVAVLVTAELGTWLGVREAATVGTIVEVFVTVRDGTWVDVLVTAIVGRVVGVWVRAKVGTCVEVGEVPDDVDIVAM